MPESSDSRDGIRVANRRDATAVAGLVAGFRDHLGAATPRDDELAVRLPNLLEDGRSEFALGLSGNQVVGYTLTRFFPSLWNGGFEAFLEDLFVHSSARRRGWGRRLVTNAISRAEERGCTSIALNTNERNDSALALYRAMGFELQTEAVWKGGREVRLLRRLSSGSTETR